MITNPRTLRSRAVALLAGMIAASLSAIGPRAWAGEPPLAAPAVRAGFALNLTQFVLWPNWVFAEAGAALVVGTLPQDPIAPELEALARGERFNGQPIRTLRLQVPDDVLKCHAVFFSRGMPRQEAFIARAARRPILLIGESDNFLELGGHVRLVSQAPQIRLRLSVENLKASELSSRPQLLRVALP